MIRIRIFRLVVGSLLVALAGCAAPARVPVPAPAPAPAPTPKPVQVPSWQMRTFERTTGDCKGPESPCLSIKMRWPELVGISFKEARNAARWFVQEHMLAPVISEVRPPDPETLSAELASEYERLRKEFADYRTPWFLEREVAVVFSSGSVLSLGFSESLFTGGNHPNARRVYRSLDLKTGRRVEYKDFLAKGAQERFRRTVEAHFRRVRGLSADKSLAQAGFWFKDGHFVLTDNVALTGTGLLIYYNAYEVAPYALGPTEVKIPYGELKGLLREDGVMSGIP